LLLQLLDEKARAARAMPSGRPRRRRGGPKAEDCSRKSSVPPIFLLGTEEKDVAELVARQRATLMSQATTDLLDVWIPANSLGYVNLNDGVIGLLG
jgi:hypothetical protein